MYSQQTLQDMLDKVRQQRQQLPNTEVRPWTDFQPQTLSWQKPNDMNMYQQLQDAVTATDEQASALASVKAQNQYNYNQMLQQLKQNQLAKNNYVAPGGFPGSNSTNNAGGAPHTVVQTASGGTLSTPGLNVNAPMRTYSFHGINYTVNSSVANRFKGFLNALWARGYHPKSIGGYANRNIAGTNTKSLHSLGLAIDIDPGRNPVFYNGVGGAYALPPSVGALAAKYGLSWGGNWKHKKDYMHFSVPYGGRQ